MEVTDTLQHSDLLPSRRRLPRHNPGHLPQCRRLHPHRPPLRPLLHRNHTHPIILTRPHSHDRRVRRHPHNRNVRRRRGNRLVYRSIQDDDERQRRHIRCQNHGEDHGHYRR